MSGSRASSAATAAKRKKSTKRAAKGAAKPRARTTTSQRGTPKRRGGQGKGKRHLVIVESPAKAETIGRFLDDAYLVDSSYGHVRDLPRRADERPASIREEKWAELGVNVDADYAPVYIVPDEKRSHVERLREALKEADRLILATDEDREGESISWHLLELLEPAVPVDRIVFHEVTPKAIEAALETPRALDRNLVAAQESRRILDRLFGYSLSPLLWRKVQAGLSAGRVQSVAVRLLVQRERERARFHPAEYWDLEATVAAAEGSCRTTLRRLGRARLPTGKDFDPSTGKLKSKGMRALSEKEAQALIPELRAGAWSVSNIKASPVTSRPAAPFTTSTLQQEANRKLGFGAARTMRAAQRLYEGINLGAEREGLITYMRTDSVTLAASALDEAQEVIRARFGENFAKGPRFYTSKTRNAQEAHEAIRPTHIHRDPQQLKGVLPDDDLRLYALIWQRTLASQMPDAKLERTVVEFTVPLGNKVDDPAIFEARGQRILFPGYLRVYQESSDDPEDERSGNEQPLPTFATGERVEAKAITPKRHETLPPARFTEASLIKRLEEEGLGRPSTYAAILDTIQARDYAFKMKAGNALAPTFLAFAVTELLERHFGDLVEPRFTAQMEETLDDIARGEADAVTHLQRFYRGSREEPGLEPRIDNELPNIAFPAIPVPVGDDPQSRESMTVRIGRFGPYLQKGQGENGSTVSLPQDLPPADLSVDKAAALFATRENEPRKLGRDPESGLDVLLQTGRYGAYVQLGPNPPNDGKRAKKNAPKPRRASVPKGVELQEVTIEDALTWLSLPRKLGSDPKTGEDVIAASGRYGPYIRSGKESRSLQDTDDIYTISLDRALELLAEPRSTGFRRRQRARVLAEIGKHPQSGAPIQALQGRYGPYVSDGTINASIPPDLDPATLDLERAVTLIAERASQPKRGGRRRTAKKGARKTARTASAVKAKAKTAQANPDL